MLTGPYKSRHRAIQSCYLAAKSLQHDIFAVQDGGQCFSSSTAESTYNKYGKSTNCVGDGKGGPMANDVYRIRSSKQWIINCINEIS